MAIEDIPNEDLILCYDGLGICVLVYDSRQSSAWREHSYYYITNEFPNDVLKTKVMYLRDTDRWKLVARKNGQTVNIPFSLAFPLSQDDDQVIAVKYWL